MFSRWTINDEKSKIGNTRNDSGASDEPLRTRTLESPQLELDRPDWQLPDIARLSVLKVPDVETPASETAVFYHTEKFDVPIVMDFSLAYPEASRSK